MKKIVKFIGFVFLAAYIGNGYGSQDYGKFLTHAYIGAATGLTAFTVSAVIQRTTLNNQQSSDATIAFSALAAALCAIPAYCTAQYFTNRIELLKSRIENQEKELKEELKAAIEKNKEHEDTIVSLQNAIKSKKKHNEFKKLDVEESQKKIEEKENKIESLNQQISCKRPSQAVIDEQHSLMVKLLEQILKNQEYEEKFSPNTTFSDASLKALINALQEPVESDAKSLKMLDMINGKSVENLLSDSSCNDFVVMIQDSDGGYCEANTFHQLLGKRDRRIISSKENSSLPRQYSKKDLLDISFFFKNRLDSSKILRGKASGITVGEFISNYKPIIKDNFILRIFSLYCKKER